MLLRHARLSCQVLHVLVHMHQQAAAGGCDTPVMSSGHAWQAAVTPLLHQAWQAAVTPLLRQALYVLVDMASRMQQAAQQAAAGRSRPQQAAAGRSRPHSRPQAGVL
jgi:hypothetical protein